MSPPGVASPAGPSSPRSQWPQMRGSLPEAAANALSKARKGSPPGVTPTHSASSLAGSTGAGGGAMAAAAAKLSKLSMLPPGVAHAGLGVAPTQPIANRGAQRAGVVRGLCRGHAWPWRTASTIAAAQWPPS